MTTNEKTYLLKEFIIEIPKEPKNPKDFLNINTYSYEPLTLEELQFSYQDPFWQKLRKFMFYMYFVVLAATLVSACIIAYSASRSMSCISKAVIDNSTTENSNNSTLFNALINSIKIDDVIH